MPPAYYNARPAPPAGTGAIDCAADGPLPGFQEFHMFPLAGKAFPTSAEQLARGIHDALADVFTLPKQDRTVTASGGSFPAIQLLKVDLDGATVRATELPPKPKPTGGRERGVTVDRFEVTGRPIRYQQSQVNLGVTADGVALDVARDASGQPLLV